MVKLNKRIKVIKQDLNIKNSNNKYKNAIITIVILAFLIITGYVLYTKILPIFNTVNINEITGKKINITECNTKDYIIISKDKSFSMNLTNSNCKQEYYEGDIKIFKNQIILNDKIKGTVNNDNSITINNNIFKGEK